MNTFPSVIRPLLSFFNFVSSPQPQNEFFETVARVHALILVALQDARLSPLEEQIIEGDQFIRAYFQTVRGDEAPPNKLEPHTLLEFLRSTFSVPYEFSVDAAQGVLLDHNNTTHRLFPFFLAKAGRVHWFLKVKPGLLVYRDAGDERVNIASDSSSFEQLLDGFLERDIREFSVKS